jgi:2-(1,2-epoxy-1,2-dihydrophenyl)acetyl-CoA isomerase
MGLPTPTKTFECDITDGLARVILNRPDKGNPIDCEFRREFSLGMAEISERDDVRAVLMCARQTVQRGRRSCRAGRAGYGVARNDRDLDRGLHAAIVRMA